MKARLTVISADDPDRLTKEYRLNESGVLQKESGGCLLDGTFEVKSMNAPKDLAHLITGLKKNQALTFGIPEFDTGRITTARRFEADGRPAGVTTRTNETFSFPSGPGWMFIDYDPIGDGKRVLNREELFFLIEKAVPGIFDAGAVWLPSSSSHIFNGDIDLTGLRGQRIYLPVQDATDIPRAGAILHDRLWLIGKGRYDVSKSGSLLDRSLVDTSVWQPSRLDFGAGASCVSPLKQKRGEPFIQNGNEQHLDTQKVFQDLKRPEKLQLAELKEKSRSAKKTEAKRVKTNWLDARIEKECGTKASTEERNRVKERLMVASETNTLGPDFKLMIVSPSGKQEILVAEVLSDPDRYDGLRCLDPLEPDYDTSGCANLYLAEGREVLHSYAHGGKDYKLLKKEPASNNADPTNPETYGIELHVKSMKGGTPVWFWKQDNGNYLPGNSQDTRKSLLTNGVPDLAGTSGQKLVDELMQRTRLEQDLAFAGVVAGYDAGIQQISGMKVLCTQSPKIPAMDSTSDPSMLYLTLRGIFPDPESFNRFSAWLFGAWEMLSNREYHPLPALALVGPAGCGKSLLFELIRWILGDYPTGKGIKFLRGETNFNADLCESVLIATDDEIPPSGPKARHALGQSIKGIATCLPQRIEAKGIDAVTLLPHWRVVIATNTEPEKVTVLPPIDESTEDKILILRCEKNTLPFEEDGREIRLQKLKDAVPGWLALQDAMRDSYTQYADTRFRYVRGWQDPDILELLAVHEPEAKLLSLIDMIASNTALRNPFLRVWKGSSAQLEMLVREHESTRHMAQGIFTWRNACGTYLEKLSKRYPERVRRAMPIRSREWEIVKEGVDFPEPELSISA